mgnify:CR=1 FL=1
MSKAVAKTMQELASRPGMIGLIAALLLTLMAMAELMVE